jgi:hypothetical protein
MVISKENDRAPGYQTGPFWNVPRISIAITLLAIIFLSAIQRIPYPALVIPSAILSFLFFAVRYWWERGRLKAKPASTRLILGGLLFLGGATYGAIEVALGQADKLDLLALVIPAFLGGWLLRQGLMIKHRHQNGHITGG